MKNIKLLIGGAIQHITLIKQTFDYEKGTRVPLDDNGYITFPDPPSDVVMPTNDLKLKIKKHLEIFEHNIEVIVNGRIDLGVSLSEDIIVVITHDFCAFKQSGDKLLPNPDFDNEYPDLKFNNFRRWARSSKRVLDTPIEDGVGCMPGGYTEVAEKLCMIFVYDGQDMDTVATIISHEIGHALGLHHRGDIQNTITDQKTGKKTNQIKDLYDNYYNMEKDRVNPDWSPIMGATQTRAPSYDPNGAMVQWANSDYVYAYPKSSSAGIADDDISLISMPMNPLVGNNFPLLKTPGNLVKTQYRKQKPWAGGERPFLKNDTKYARILSSIPDFIDNNNKNFYYGMIGYPYDYDIIKVLLPRGRYQFSVSSSDLDGTGRVTYSMLYPDLHVMRANIELDKMKNNIDVSNKLLFDDLNYPGSTYNFLQQVKIANLNEKKYEADEGFAYTLFNKELFVILKYTSIVYLRICGGYKGPVDEFEVPNQGYKGFSRYGSVGKYKLNITEFSKGETNANILNDNDIPNAHVEEFYICKDGEGKKYPLFVRDGYDDDSITGDSNGAHLLPLLVKYTEPDGTVTTSSKYFLVYGQPINIDAEEEEGKFFLEISVNGESKKQEFIVPSHWIDQDTGDDFVF
jgi:hypothetical protein